MLFTFPSRYWYTIGLPGVILRREAYPNPYETLKALTRTNEKLTAEKIHDFIETLEVSEDVKEELRAISPSTYTGI